MSPSMNLSELIHHAAVRDLPDEEFSETPDLEKDLDQHKLSCEVGLLRQELKEAKENHTLRLNYSGKIFFLVCSWLVCVAISVFLSGFSFKGFSLSDKVLITFITSTTVNVVGLFIVVAKWMFPVKPNDK